MTYYHCPECGEHWEDEYDCACDSECPTCGKDYTPHTYEKVE